MALDGLGYLIIAVVFIFWITPKIHWWYYRSGFFYNPPEATVSDETLNSDEVSAFSAAMFLAMEE